MQFTSQQVELVLAAEAASDRATALFLETCDAETREDKLRLWAAYHAAVLAEIELLRQAGDPDAAQRLEAENANYDRTRKAYETWEHRAPEAMSEWEQTRRKVLRAQRQPLGTEAETD